LRSFAEFFDVFTDLKKFSKDRLCLAPFREQGIHRLFLLVFAHFPATNFFAEKIVQS